MIRKAAACAAGLFCALLPAAAGAAGGGAHVLDTHGIWRMHATLGPPVIQTGGGVETVRLKQKWLNWEPPGPPKDWPKPAFDDRTWLRGPARRCRRRL